jgi:hypothetical protein
MTMASMWGALRSALIEAGVTEVSADRAAEEVASYDNRLASMATDINLLKWVGASNTAMLVALMWRLFSHGAPR